MSGSNPFGSASWPMVTGNAGNTGAASVAASLGGKTLWSVPLPSGSGCRMVVGEDGGLFVASSGSLLALDPNGEVRWLRPRTGEGGFGTPMALADGSIVLTEDHGRKLLSLDQVTGVERWCLMGWWSTAGATATGDGGLVVRRALSDEAPVELCCLDPSGALRWCYRPGKIANKSLVTKDLIVIVDGASLTGVDTGGHFLWLANRHGFVFGDRAKDIARTAEDVLFFTAPMRLDESRIIIGCSYYEGDNFLILDPSRAAAVTCEAFPSDGPIVVTPGRVPHLAGAAGTALLVFDTSGTLLFERGVPWEILNIVSDRAGNLIVAEGVEPDYWRKYKDWYKLHDACGVVGFDAAGNQLFRWTAPGPMASAMAVGR
jgi:outer membrane protein assembly factor BamB